MTPNSGCIKEIYHLVNCIGNKQAWYNLDTGKVLPCEIENVAVLPFSRLTRPNVVLLVWGLEEL